MTSEKGSRILLTTRQKEVGFRGKDNTDPLNLRLLKPEESWELLEKRAFGKESFPVEILDVWKRQSVWLEGRNNLNSFILNSEVDVMKVIELSYDHLPHHMKPCFLYLAFFPKETALTRVMLKMSWRTERLVELTEIMSLEEVMEIYLDNLISNSLVIHFNEIGDDPTCQLHDLVHNFCLLKARVEKLFSKISSSDPSFFSDLMPRIVSIDYDKENFGPNTFFLFSSKKKRHSGKHLYSLKITGHEMVMALAKWDFGEESFPMLEKLELWGCRKLEEIPPSFGNICSLKIIKLVKIPQLEDSAKKIKQYIEDMGGGEFQRKKLCWNIVGVAVSSTRRDNLAVMLALRLLLNNRQEADYKSNAGWFGQS
ncbi:putative late blight resistance protein homolog R1B-17 [Capsicum annuum]|uniref:putative late blight resistance protein homolog R1B-17 n=1 Tax=Capsicum annuum TaxID=4072 RepID=UPI001FB0EDCB|nr:putative late blight resistance protein homolog R1B-17 [Capsicum annuum]